MRVFKSANAGVTLLELLVTLAVLAMISTAVASTLGYAVRIYDRSAEIERRTQSVQSRVALRRWIVRAVPAFPTAASLDFLGDTDGFRFVTGADTALSWDTGRLFVQVIARDGRTQMRLSPRADGAPVQDVDLAPVSLRFYYFGRIDGQLAWHERWDAPGSLPQLIRLSGDDPAIWPDFIVAPMLVN